MVVEEQIDQLARSLDFVAKHLGTPAAIRSGEARTPAG
jgi:hypothetical protein